MRQDAQQFLTEGPLRKFLLITMKPAKALLIFRWVAIKNKHEYIHEKIGVYMRTGTVPARMALFGYGIGLAK